MFAEKKSPVYRFAIMVITLMLVVSNLRPEFWKAFFPEDVYAKTLTGSIVYPLAASSLIKIEGNEPEALIEAGEMSIETIIGNEDDSILSLAGGFELSKSSAAGEAEKISERSLELDLEDVEDSDVLIPEIPEPTPAPAELTYVNNPNMVINLTEYELDLLEKLVQGEAGNQDMIGKILVANVVINRVNSSAFPNTVYYVIDQPGQFSRVSSGRFDNIVASDSTKEAVRRALAGEDYSNGAFYYVNRHYVSSRTMSWFDNYLVKVLEHGDHEFFR